MNKELEQLLLETLSFYADPENWERPVNTFSGGQLDSIAMKDAGSLAKIALEKIKSQAEA